MRLFIRKKNERMITKRKKKKEKTNDQEIGHELLQQHLQRLKYQHQEKSS